MHGKNRYIFVQGMQWASDKFHVLMCVSVRRGCKCWCSRTARPPVPPTAPYRFPLIKMLTSSLCSLRSASCLWKVGWGGERLVLLSSQGGQRNWVKRGEKILLLCSGGRVTVIEISAAVYCCPITRHVLSFHMEFQPSAL